MWFDRYNERRGFKQESANVFRCRFNEQVALETAVQFLTDAGHHRIGYPFIGTEPWVIDRGNVLERLVAARSARNRLFTAPVLERLRSDRVTLEQLRRAVDTVCTGMRGRFQSVVAPLTGRVLTDRDVENFRMHRNDRMLNFLTWSPAIIALLENEVTALICPNDRTAWGVNWWLSTAGLRVPHDISLLSFDNDIREKPTAVSSVDFGFDHLGYAAFHLINRTVPVRHDRYGNVAPRPFVADHGTVAFIG